MTQRPLRCLITGANTGLGFEVAKLLLQRGHEVMIACRDPEKAKRAVENLQRVAASKLPPILPPDQSNNSGSRDHAANHHAVFDSSRSQHEAGSTRVRSVQCDLSSFDSVRRCATAVKLQWPELDVLVCNAAVIPSTPSRTADGINEQLQVNHLSHFLLVDLLLPCLLAAADTKAAAAAQCRDASQHKQMQLVQQQQQQDCFPSSSRVVVVGSKLYVQTPADFQDPVKLKQLLPAQCGSSGTDAAAGLLPMQLYALTKMCNLWFVQFLSKHVLAAAGGRVVGHVVSPGFIPNTDLGRHVSGSPLKHFVMKFIMPWAPFAVTPKEGAERVVEVCLGEEAGRSSGQFWSRRITEQPSPAAQDDVKAAGCWRISCQATDVPLDTYGTIKVASV